MSVVKTNSLQIGQSVTATNNFTWYQPATPDGTVRLGNGNSGSVTDLVTLTSAGNLGIGTSSPGNRLHVNGSGDVARFTNSTQSAYMALDSGGFSILTGAGQTGNGIYASATNNTLQLFTNSSSKATLDSSGNLGLGVTPSAWDTNFKVFQLGASGRNVAISIQGDADAMQLWSNAYRDTGGTERYIASRAAGKNVMNGNTFAWFTAPSGTAGNAISFTQAMTLDASGNLLVGTTSQYGSAKVSVNGFVASSATGGGVFYTNTTTNEEVAYASAKTILGGTYVATDACIYTGKSTSKIYAMAYTQGVYLNTSGTSWTSNSDERLKTDLKPILNAAQKVSTLRAVTGRYKTDEEGVSRSFLIAQDVQAVLPEAVDASDPDKLGVQYTDTIPLLVAAIKEISAELNELKKKVNA